MLKCAFCVYQLVTRQELGLPMKKRDIAHDFKLAPVLYDSTNYIDWCKKLDVGVELTELPEEKKALAIFPSLGSKTKKAVLQLEIKDPKVRAGIVKLKEKLDKTFS